MNKKKGIFAGIIALALILTFFVKREFNAETNSRNMAFVGNGVQFFRKGLDVSGGTRLVYKINYDKYDQIYTNKTELAAVKKTIETIILKNIDKRISKLGVSDYKAFVQKLGQQNYINVEIGGVADLDQAKGIIGKTLEIEFKLQNLEKTTPATIAERQKIAQKLYTEITKNPDVMLKLVEGRASENIYPGMYSGATRDELPDLYKANIDKISKLKPGQIFPGILDGKYTTLTSQGQSGVQSVDLNGFAIVRYLGQGSKIISGKQETIYNLEDVFVQDRMTWIQAVDSQGNALNGAYFKFANTSTSQVGEPVVAINFDDKGKAIFCDLTEKNIGNPMAIFIGGQMLTAPTIQSKICGGSAQIDGSFTSESAKELATALNDGAMPAPLILMQEEKISPSLGDFALTGALIAGLIGLIAIAVLMVVMYGVKKMMLTMIVMLSFIAVLAGFMKFTDYALSLPGIAAIILSIGMAVDANILMYERLREEIKAGRTRSGAIDVARARSRTAIRDGQVSTGLIALLLFFMGTNIFKGFGAMMLTTMLLTLLFNVPLTHMLLHVFYDKSENKSENKSDKK